MESVLGAIPRGDLRVFVVWEPVLASDWGPPLSGVLARIPDRRVVQYWDKERVLSRAMSQAVAVDPKKGVVWDYIALFHKGVLWGDTFPAPYFSARPVVRAEISLFGQLSR